jgi:hypothetical protein
MTVLRSRVMFVAVPLAAAWFGTTACGTDDDGAPDPPDPSSCTLAAELADAGDLLALKANQCNVPMSQGQRKWYRLSATLPGTTDIVELNLWDNLGAFKGGKIRLGTFPISGEETSFTTCGVCVRALGDKGTAEQQEFLANGGTVEITALGVNNEPISATLSNLTFAQVDNATRVPVPSGCTSTLARIKMSGTVVALGMGGGNGGGGGMGGNNCPTVIGD